MPRCPVCNANPIETDGDRMRGFCETCAQQTGVWWSIESIPALRPPKPCARCNHPTFVRALLRENGGSGNYQLVQPLGLSFNTREPIFGGVAVDSRAPQGAIVAYACLQCGATELFTWLPHLVPIGPQYGTEVIDVSTSLDGGPFR